ncbi:phage regulatory protein/antirepressor Ant [Lacticaseibacillus rhamnosus]|uniref:phage antirepressor KilAC domain-containing protein n=1 Tax=Lacticaseibacillus rhamnosus TaxID=47715 RepID=UPI0007E02CAD|nr:phage regulatory protein/antirepressor Ant [Lacticaseibacillus rhamnosus]MCT3192682.1 phage regulatory protein/antirepressor Ant [Lacticaseibacillus rhamnosus]MCT3372809.1 phage regulatory protein/antirepressor Ant [Lacticaseibacillus rhamnosus]OAU10293.1 antirepressor [Lacticaseibacillus rhamnosus]OAU19335.1 antirepressor [Lacticaseibacillus rhamnosus]OAU23504.1 antirepressor [Lacticaseibacillus rhamnosus]
MNELIIMHDRQAVTTSLKVAESFGKNHRDVLAAIRDLMSSAENYAVLKKYFIDGSYTASNGKTNPMYYMNRDGFTLLAVGFTGKRALQFKIQYIQAFNSMETQIRTGYAIPGSYAEALKLAASQAEQIEDMKPKALFADAVATSHTSILIGDLAKLIRQNGVDIGQNRLFAWLREHGYLIGSGDRRNMPTQRAMDLELFDIKERTFQNPDGSVRITKTTKVTGKGQQYFINKFLQKGMAV